MSVRRGLLWPFLLILVGVAFLLANLGLLPPLSGLALLNLWPLVLILLGVEVALGHRSPAIVLGVGVLAVSAGLVVVAAQPYVLSSRPGAVAVSVAREGKGSTGPAERLSLRVNGGAGSYTLRGGSSQLVEATSDRDDLDLRTTYRGDRAEVRVDQSARRGLPIGTSAPAHVEITLASDVATSLEINAGAGEFVIDLRDVRTTDVRVNVGAASLRIVLPRPTGEVPITVSAGASSITVEIPDGVEASVTTSGALLSTTSENPRVDGGSTGGYSAAKDRVAVRVTAAASSIVIR